MERLGFFHSLTRPSSRSLTLPFPDCPMALQVTLNGKPHTVESSQKITISEFVASLEIGKQPVLVERNGEAVLVREFDQHFIEDGDVLEVIRMVAGG